VDVDVVHMMPQGGSSDQQQRGAAVERKDVNYQIRKFTPDDGPRMRELLLTRPGIEPQEADERLRMVQWMADHNPFAGDEITCYVAEDDGRIIAYLGRMPVQFVIRGELRKGYYVHDWYVHPEYRKRGLGLFIAFQLEKRAIRDSDSFCCGVWGNDASRAIVRRLGYFFVWADGYCKVLSARWLLIKWLRWPWLAYLLYPLVKLPMAVADALLRLTTPAVEIIPIERFGEEFDELYRRTLGRIGISTARTTAYLNWKYVDRPYPPDAMFAARRDGHLVGYVVLAIDPVARGRFGVILDILADPDDAAAIAGLVQASITYFRRERVDLILAIMTDRRFIAVLARYLFLKRDWARESVVMSNLDDYPGDPEVLRDLDNWHLTKGESDGFIIHRLLSRAERRRQAQGIHH
jgi:GNAT superfamily N-acetyltransferase